MREPSLDLFGPVPDLLPPSCKDLADAWQRAFPDKPQPQRRPGTRLMRKAARRMASPEFRAGWRRALDQAAANPGLRRVSWFCLEWLVANDENWRKVLDGRYDWLIEKYQEEERKADVQEAMEAKERVRRSRQAALDDYFNQAISPAMTAGDRADLYHKVADAISPAAAQRLYETVNVELQRRAQRPDPDPGLSNR